MDPSTVRVYFTGYPANSKGYWFHCPSHAIKIVEARNTKFLEDIDLNGNEFLSIIKFQEIKESVSVFPGEIIKKQPIEFQPLHVITQNSQNKSKIIGLRMSSRIRNL